MLLIWGVIAFLQMTVIPGSLALAYLRIKPESRIQGWVYTFALSLIINYLLVFSLTLMGVYKPAVIYTLLLIETALMAYHRKKNKIPTPPFRLDFKNMAARIRQFAASNSLLYNCLFLISLFFIGVFFYYLFSRWGEVFRMIDEALSWNRYAVEWFNNRLPEKSWYYPQLVSTNWSMAYVIMQNADIQFVPRGIMPLFSIGILMLFLDLGMQKKKSFYLLGLIFYGLIGITLHGPTFIASGFMDIAVTFFSFLAFYVLHLHYTGDIQRAFQTKHALLSVLFAAAAAATKQAGLYILVIVLAWNIILIYKNRAALGKKTILKITCILALIIIFIGLSWYIYRTITIIKGSDKPGIVEVTQQVHHKRTYTERFAYGFNKIMHPNRVTRNSDITLYVYLAFMLLIFSLFHRRSRVVTCVIVIPFTVLWGLFYSYSYRNLSLAFPFIAFSMAVGAYWFFQKVLPKKWTPDAPDAPDESAIPSSTAAAPAAPGRGLRVSFWHLAVGFAVIAAVLNFTVLNDEAIKKDQLEKQKLIGNQQLNQKLYQYYKKNGFEGKIFSKYKQFRVLPVLKDYLALDREDEDVYYLLDNFNTRSRQRIDEVRRKVKSGEYTLLFRFGKYWFIQVKRRAKETEEKPR
ncbi:MAG: hypothetical protein NT166_21165 [Candidatus Aminicenantes bacterium]|nr:hypothetical protein [Candidatus Aminicenantes bacterium]